MNLTDEIARLHRLRQDGALTAAEFDQAKAALLAQAGAAQSPSAPAGYGYGQAGSGSLFHDELNRVDREWMMEREHYMLRGKRGGRSEPNSIGAIVGSLFFVGFAVFWTIMAYGTGAGGFFPLFGVVFVLFGVVNGFSHIIKAQKYRQAEQRYQQRRAAILARHGQADYAQNRPDIPLYR